MQLHHLFKWFLRFLQIFALFPYSLEKPKVKRNTDENRIIYLSDNSLIYCYEIDSNFYGKFIFNKNIERFSTLWFSFIGVLGIYVGYGNIYIETEGASTYKYAMPIFYGLIYSSFIVALIQLKTKSKDLLKIIKNVQVISENHSIENFTQSWWFNRVLYSNILSLLYLLVQLIQIFRLIYNRRPIFYSLEKIFYAYKGIINMTVVLILDVICFLYSFGYNIDQLQPKTYKSKSFLDKPKNTRAVILYNYDENHIMRLEKYLKNVVAKYHLINQYQKILNSYFGILLSGILVEIMTHMIFSLYIVAEDVSDQDFWMLIIKMVKVLNFTNQIFNVFSSTEIINEKVISTVFVLGNRVITGLYLLVFDWLTICCYVSNI